MVMINNKIIVVRFWYKQTVMPHHHVAFHVTTHLGVTNIQNGSSGILGSDGKQNTAQAGARGWGGRIVFTYH